MCDIICFFPVWRNLKVANRILILKFKEYFGEDNFEIKEREQAKKYLKEKLDKVQDSLINHIKEQGSVYVILEFLKIQDEIQCLYIREKKERHKLIEQNIRTNELPEINAKIMRNIIEATNVWIENSLIFQNSKTTEVNKFKMNEQLLMDLFIYGMLSKELSLIALCKKYEEDYIYKGIKYSIKAEYPLEITKDEPIIYYNTALLGNQNCLMLDEDLANQNDSTFGNGFYNTYGIKFLYFLAVLKHIEQSILDEGRIALISVSIDQFTNILEGSTAVPINSQAIIDNFIIKKDTLKTQLRETEELIWQMNVNRIRLELCPFIQLEDGRILLSYRIIEQSMQLWVSYALNGGKAYTLNGGRSCEDELTRAMEQLNEKLSNRLVDKISEELKSKYPEGIVYKEVEYDRIWSKRDKNYGDFDIIYYVPQEKEIFLIEAKYFSDSLNASGMINDYNKLFRKKGYYAHSRERYNLVLSEPEALKKFLNIQVDVKVHFLFISSKPIELELQDKDGIVTFLSLATLSDYIDGKLINCDTDEIMQPTYSI